MSFRKPGFAVVALLLAVSFAAASAEAQFRRIDGCNFPTICVPLVPQSGPPGPVDPTCWALPILEDGWTESVRCLGPAGNFLEAETYFFSAAAEPEILFVDKVKLPSGLGLPVQYQIVEDIFVIPSNPRCQMNPMGEDFALNMRPQMLFIDDVTFRPPINVDPSEGPVEYLCAVRIPMPEFLSFFGPMTLDWFAVADLDSLGLFYGQPPTPDLDLNGCPDSCAELGVPGKFVRRVGIDEKGAALADFLVNRNAHSLTKVDVFEPQTNGFIPALLPGMAPGESHNTRPWSFTIGP